jgi:hypothetical protein
MTQQARINQQLVFHAILVSNQLKGARKTSNVYEIRDVLKSQGHDMNIAEIIHYIEALIQVKYVYFYDPEKSSHRFYRPSELGMKRWAEYQANVREVTA